MSQSQSQRMWEKGYAKGKEECAELQTTLQATQRRAKMWAEKSDELQALVDANREKENSSPRQYPVLVACALIVRDGKVLLERHAPTAEHNEYQWDLPGGKVEIGETPADAVVREIREEMGVVIEVVAMLPKLWPSVWTDPDRSKHWVLAVYECRIVEGEPAISDDLYWFDIGCLNPRKVKRPDFEIIAEWQHWNADGGGASVISGRIANLEGKLAKAEAQLAIEQGHHTAALAAAKLADWEQVRQNGGPPCFHIAGGRFCLRAQRWDGHDDDHRFTTLAEALQPVPAAEDLHAMLQAAVLGKAAAERRLAIVLSERDQFRRLYDDAVALSRQNHGAALGFQERAIKAEADLADALGPCKDCLEKSDAIRDALTPAGNGLSSMDVVGAVKLAVKWLIQYKTQVLAIRGKGRHAFRIDEGQRQALLLAMAHLAVERPGWDFMLSEIGLDMDNVVDGRPELFDKFKALYAEEIACRQR